MNPLVSKLQSLEDCANFLTNAIAKGRGDLEPDVRLRVLQIKAGHHPEVSAVEHDCLMAIYAYEELLSYRNGRKTRANRTWQVIKKYGIIPGIERLVSKEQDPTGIGVLRDMGLSEYTFENVVVRHPDAFSSEAVVFSKARLSSFA